MTDAHVTLLEQRMNATFQRVDAKLDSITELLQGLVRLEERQIQANEKLKDVSADVADLDKRLRGVETAMPGLKELRGWVISGVLAGVGMMATAVFSYLSTKGHL
jgi:chromosome segregation ATPase